MIHYKPVKITIKASGLVKVIIDVIVYYHGFLNLIIIDWSSLFILKFWSLICYFFDIKRGLFIIFYLQINGQTKRQNSIMEAYFYVFVNFEQNN